VALVCKDKVFRAICDMICDLKQRFRISQRLSRSRAGRIRMKPVKHVVGGYEEIEWTYPENVDAYV
jgi:hypothetical protein